MLFKTMTDVSMNLIAVLSALNEQYVHHPRFKWVEQTVERFKIKPENFSRRMLGIFGGNEPGQAVQELEALVMETISLVESECPAVDIGSLRNKASAIRPGVK